MRHRRDCVRFMGQNPERPGRALNEKRARLPEQAVSHCTGGGAGGPCGVNPPDTAKIHIGTCAWTHDDWRGVFYPEHLPSSERLAFYARWFDAVEVDSTFYHIPASHVTAHWAEVTPPGFRFSCKVPREITHERKLRDVDEPLAAFLHGVKPLREKTERRGIRLRERREIVPRPRDVVMLEQMHDPRQMPRLVAEFHCPRKAVRQRADEIAQRVLVMSR